MDKSEIGRYDSGNDGSSLPLRNGNSMQCFKCIMKIPYTKLQFDKFNKHTQFGVSASNGSRDMGRTKSWRKKKKKKKKKEKKKEK